MAPTRVILMSCGSYNPPTNMHLRMFEIARDHLHRMGTHVVVGGVISPVHDAYSKKELASATHRCSMLRLALQNNDWIRLSTWETRQNCWTKTRLCLQHHQNLLNSMLSSSNNVIPHLQMEDIDWIPENVRNSSDITPIQIKLLCGADLLESFGICGLWVEEDIHAIVGEYGLVVITREGSNPNKFIYDSDILSKHIHNICIVTEWIPNEVSSSRIRRALKRSESVRYLLQDSVIDYIYKNEIYDAKAMDVIKLELLSPNANNYLHIEPRYLSAFLTPSPSDVNMGSPCPIEISAVSIDMPDAVLRRNMQNAMGDAEIREQFISVVTSDNSSVKHVARSPAYPGQAKQVVVTSGVARIVDEVGDPLDEATMKLCQPGPSTSGEFVLEESYKSSSTVGNVTKGKIYIEQKIVSNLGSNTDNANVDLDASDNREIIVRVQPGSLNSSELVLKESRRSIIESVAENKTGVIQKEVSDLKTMQIGDISLDSSVDREIIIKASSELGLKECCWPTREDRANDREIISQKRIVDVDSDNGESAISLNKTALENFIKEKTDVSNRAISLKGKTADIETDFANAGNVVEVQPSSIYHNIVTVKNYTLSSDKSKINLDEGETLSEKYLESRQIDKNGRTRGESDDKEISSKRKTADFKFDKFEHLKTKATISPNISMTSLDGRYECALSDFSVDKEDFRLNQYGSDEDEENYGKPLQNIKSNLTKEIDCRVISSEESPQSDFVTKGSLSEVKKDDRFDIKNKEREERFRTSKEMEELRRMEKRSELDSSEKRRKSCDSNIEIDGKYLKSIVNSRKSPRKTRKDQIRDIEIKELNQQAFQSEVVLSSFTKTRSSGRIKESQILDVDIVDSSTKSPKKIEGENICEFKDEDKSISDREIFRSEKASLKCIKTSSKSARSPRKTRGKEIRHKSSEIKDYDRSINDRVISQLEEVFQKSSKKSSAKMESPKKVSKNFEAKSQYQVMTDKYSQQTSSATLKMSSTKSPKRAHSQRDVKTDDRKMVDDGPKQNFNEIRDVYTRKVRRYNMPLKGSLDSVIVFDESPTRKTKQDDTFAKKSKSYESIKRIQEMFLGVPGKMSNSGSQLDIPDDFCSICCYMNEITFRTEEEVSSPNQETFYTLRSACSSLGDEDESIDCDICNSLNLQESAEGKMALANSGEEINCELCKICGEVDGSFEHDPVIPADRHAFKRTDPNKDDDDSFEIENCGFQSGPESVDDQSRISEKEKIKDAARPKSSLFIHGSPMVKDQQRELYFIPKDEIAILTSGTKKVSRKGSLFKKKEDTSGRSNRRYSSVDTLQLAKMSAKVGDKALKVAKKLVGSADNLRILRRDFRRSKSLQRSADNLDCLRSSTDNLDSLVKNAGKEESTAQTPTDGTQKSIRDKEAVKMILTQHGIKIISERETAL